MNFVLSSLTSADIVYIINLATMIRFCLQSSSYYGLGVTRLQVLIQKGKLRETQTSHEAPATKQEA